MCCRYLLKKITLYGNLTDRKAWLSLLSVEECQLRVRSKTPQYLDDRLYLVFERPFGPINQADKVKSQLSIFVPFLYTL